ncbi:hypothetical protein WA026_013477 [Henosepilachna vigintioctopunctata]|uniref:Uncharacterized protein n=1 Tax=Henosepilachna vigintioctopunctata TaxID=420089 RepID=A0AAW1V8X0_9CUCU
MRGISVLLIVILCVSFVQCANILGIWFTGEKSHFILGETLFIELARRGHNVTMASPFYSKKSSANYTNIVLNGFGKLKISIRKFSWNVTVRLRVWWKTSSRKLDDRPK